MISINLLPEDKRKKRKKSFSVPRINVKSRSLVMGSAMAIIVLHLALIGLLNYNKTVLEKMNKEWLAVEPGMKMVEGLKKENAETARHVETINTLVAKKVMWHRKLNQLSDLVAPGIWYTRLSLDEKLKTVEVPQAPGQKKAAKTEKIKIGIPYLSIEGEAASVYGGELALIGKFINGLKSDEEFFKDFSDIELDSTELHSILEADVVKFRINCYFKEIGADGRGQI